MGDVFSLCVLLLCQRFYTKTPNAAAKPNKIAMKYGKEVRDSALSALQSGMTLRQCSETYGIPKKTLSKWKSRELKQEVDEGESMQLQAAIKTINYLIISKMH